MVRVKTFHTTDIMQNASKVFEINDKEIAIVNYDNAYYAIDDLCSHSEAVCQMGKYMTVKLSAHFMEQSLILPQERQ